EKLKKNSLFNYSIERVREGKLPLREVTAFLVKTQFANRKKNFKEIVGYLNKIQRANETRFEYMPTSDWLYIGVKRRGKGMRVLLFCFALLAEITNTFKATLSL